MKHCVVFGGSRGIGSEIAKLLLLENHNVTIVSRSSENIKRFIDGTLKITNKTPIGLTGNVENEEEVIKVLDTAEKQFGPVNVIVNAAGINKDNLLVRTKISEMSAVINTNLIGPMITTKIALRSMLQQKKGCIINIGSIVGQHGNSGQCVYGASKAGLMGFTKSLAKEVGSRGIRANLVVPGFIETEMTAHLSEKQKEAFSRIPLQRYGQPSDVAHLVHFLIENKFITGQVLYVDGGLHLTM